ncbi:peptidase [Streptomyces sp. NBC_00654]|uniref:peptidase n=1 Tax=Streptomyces sp. NBC_00654 TaxID=2975799 RepID=UPI0022512BE3|nr:peptidase [Streptomyces sp. NBC_00654]MCX4964907.1 peptidase [Streptomyces sp. NBC_00654]
MNQTRTSRRVLRGGVGALAAVALTGLGATPALADEEEPDLGIGNLARITGAEPGGGFGMPFSVLNKGTEEVAKVWVSYAVSPGLRAADSYSNCEYATAYSHDERPDSHYAVCAIDQPLKPGVVYVPERPVGLKALDSAMYDDVYMTVNGTEPAPSGDGESDPVPGTGAPLKLVEKGPADEADREKHPERYAMADVTSDNTADYALTGAKLSGKVGDKVTAAVKFINKGPAWVYLEQGQGAATVDIRIPAGTSVVKPDGFCDKVTTSHYRCGTSQSWVDENAGETYSFVLRIDKAVDNAVGKVKFTGKARPFDRNPANDTAEIVINAGTGGTGGSTGTTGGSSGSASTGGSTGSTGGSSGSTGTTSGSSGSTGTTSGSSGTTGGSTTGTTGSQTTAGGDLAATGATSTGPMIGAAAAALAAGGGILYAVRRRSAAQR